MTETLETTKDADSILFRTGDPDFMNSLARGVAVLQAFSDTTTGLKMSHISVRTGLSRAVVRRCLYTLEQLGYVRQNADGYYLKPKILSLSQTYFSSSSLTSQAQEFLDRVKEATGESCSLAVLDEDEVVYVARSAAQKIMTVSLGIGSRLPAYCTSLGRILLAALPPKELANLLGKTNRLKHTQFTKTSLRDLNGAISIARDKGFALTDQELEVGLRSIAVPLRNQEQKVVAAINVGVQAASVNKRKMTTEILPVLESAATGLGSQLIC
jgi:IclR family pca regulon transcriptional regulator